jgi:hypothetical protein
MTTLILIILFFPTDIILFGQYDSHLLAHLDIGPPLHA